MSRPTFKTFTYRFDPMRAEVVLLALHRMLERVPRIEFGEQQLMIARVVLQDISLARERAFDGIIDHGDDGSDDGSQEGQQSFPV